jgi:trehalose 6-phosphate phosphatase
MNTPSEIPTLDIDADPAARSALISNLARAQRLAIITDFDGTLAPPGADAPIPAALAALRQLAALHNTAVAVLSARELASLQHIFAADPAFTLLGSFGLENPWTTPRQLSTDESAALDALAADLSARYTQTSGARIERKPLGLALHLPADAAPPTLNLPAALRAVRAGTGLEITVADASKAVGLALARARLAPDAILFAGDDDSDESALAALTAADLGLKIGRSPTCAHWRTPSPNSFAALLFELALKRRAG